MSDRKDVTTAWNDLKREVWTNILTPHVLPIVQWLNRTLARWK